MIQLYTMKGLSEEDAKTVVEILSKNKPFFVDVMMKEELELLPPDNSVNPIISSNFYNIIIILIK